MRSTKSYFLLGFMCICFWIHLCLLITPYLLSKRFQITLIGAKVRLIILCNGFTKIFLIFISWLGFISRLFRFNSIVFIHWLSSTFCLVSASSCVSWFIFCNIVSAIIYRVLIGLQKLWLFHWRVESLLLIESWFWLYIW